MDKTQSKLLAERESQMLQAARDYALGDNMSVEEYEEAERRYTPDYEKTINALSEPRTRHERYERGEQSGKVQF